jgi:hypothetical protein
VPAGRGSNPALDISPAQISSVFGNQDSPILILSHRQKLFISARFFLFPNLPMFGMLIMEQEWRVEK